MKKPLPAFFRSVALLLLLNMLIKPVWIFYIDRHVQLLTGPALYGRYFALYNFSLVFIMLADAGLSVYYNREGAAGGISLHRFISFLRLKALLLFVYVIIVLAAALAWGLPVNSLLLLLVLLQAGTSLLVFLRANLTALQLYKTDAFISVLDKLLVIVITGWLLFITKPAWFGIGWFAGIQAITVCITLCIAGYWVLRHIRKAEPVADAPFTYRSQIKQALPYSAVVLLMALVYRAQGVLLQQLHPDGDTEAGIYANGFRLLDAFNMVGYLLAAFLLPFISKHAGDQPLLVAVTRKSRAWLLTAATAAAIFCIFNRAWLYELLYYTNDARQAQVMALTFLGIIGCSMVHVYSTVLTATGHIRRLGWVSLVAAVVCLAAGYTWIPIYGALAAAVITCAGQLLYGLALLAACTNRELLPADGRFWLIWAAVTCAAICIFTLL